MGMGNKRLLSTNGGRCRVMFTCAPTFSLSASCIRLSKVWTANIAFLPSAARTAGEALSRSAPPEVWAHWTMHLLTDRRVEWEAMESISDATVRRMVNKTTVSSGSKRLPESERVHQTREAWVKARNAARSTVEWRFATADARLAFHRFYPKSLSEKL